MGNYEHGAEFSAQDLYEAPILGQPSAVSAVTLFSGEVSDGGIIFGD
jgi:hypothetical protein